MGVVVNGGVGEGCLNRVKNGPGRELLANHPLRTTRVAMFSDDPAMHTVWRDV